MTATAWLRRHVEAILAFGLALLFTAAALWLPAWQALERRGFDALTVLAAPGESTQPIVLVAINEESFEALKHRWPWPRSVHAQLLDRLVAGGAAVVAFDVLLADASDAGDDLAFAEAIRRAGNVVLAADFTYAETHAARLWKRTEPLELFIRAGAVAGLATVPLDPDQFVRNIPVEPDAFWRQIVKLLQVRVPSLAVPPLPEPGAMIRYLGGEGMYPAIPYHLVLAATPEELKGAFEGRIVIVGRNLRAAPELGMAQGDLFATPFLSDAGGLQAGIKIHATLVENALAGIAIRPGGAFAILLANLVAALGVALAFRRAKPHIAAVVAALLVAAFSGIAWLAFSRANLWIPFAAPMAVVLATWLMNLARAYLSERARKQEVHQAFSMYVAPTVVDQLLADPKRLALGGEAREITVMFTDLAGFTKLTEKTAPDIVSRVLTEHFTAMTDIVLAHGGTVIQFIGDAIMAFWGAPLDDREHRRHATQAAVAMQRGMANLRRDFAAQGLPEIHMRVGLNTGTAVVGNMGSRRRFAYSALGDCVNLASRLEGANKLYGTGILMSGETAKGAGGAMAFRHVDRVRVAGKTEAVDVYTPCDDPAFIAASEIALSATFARDWDGAEGAWRGLLAGHPDDRGIGLHLQRIAAWRQSPPPVGWDGGVSIDKL
ncbi:MAG TPA: adenylate/guanylate cyclase domain-containing protein [Usitatibacteraceae bacterium]|nr:adenylate/guanylate cyclase domain-containing protein [Usitatibacteraceae bacterium]